MTGREERIARNEVLFRDLNGRVEQIVTTLADERPDRLEIFCECGTGDCVTKLTLALTDYEGARAHPERFIVAPDHDTPEVEKLSSSAPASGSLKSTRKRPRSLVS